MKKIMIMLAAVAVAVAANAGSVNWNFSGVVDPTDMGLNLEGGVAYLFESSVSATDVEASIIDGSFATAFAGSAVYTGEFEDGEFSYRTILNGEYSGSTTFYSVVLDSDTETGFYFMTDEVTQTIGASGAKNFTYQYADNTGTWQAVPEPTSGLLLLLGVAGLALRRKQA